ncbi:MAG: class I SAM-dependent methyltransferase [Candidatus Omnitrophica bacterium]|nr:class I SAM-dependent methyltransferase [Candidatus Omnitrophota bacterium]
MMKNRLLRILSILLCFLLCFEQSGFAQIIGQLDVSGHLAGLHNAFAPDAFRPLHLRYLSYDTLNNSFKLLLDKGDQLKGFIPDKVAVPEVELATKELMNYFFIGLTLPNDSFWVNLRPDSPDNIIDPALAQTDVGRILLESDLQLKKDTARFTSPQTPEGKEYWDKLYQKAGEIFGSQNITIPTLTRPWIVPDEIIIRETTDSVYIYKATLKVMLEQDYLKDSAVYNFQDDRLKELNEYSSQLIRELIIPKLTQELNSSKRYASLRQVYYSLIMAQWFKARFINQNSPYSRLINRRDLTGLTSKEDWSKSTYFQAYQKSFKDGEYNIQEPVYSVFGQTIRSYFSGGEIFNLGQMPKQGEEIRNPETGTTISSIPTSITISKAITKGKNLLSVMLVITGIGLGSANSAEVKVINAETPPAIEYLDKVGAVEGIAQKVTLLFHKHINPELVNIYMEQLTNIDIMFAKRFVERDTDIKKERGIEEGMKYLLGLTELNTEEYDKQYRDSLNTLSRYRMLVSEIWSKESSLIKKFREEIEVIKGGVSQHAFSAIGIELTPEELTRQKKSAKDLRKEIIDNLKAADATDYLQREDDLFLTLVGPEVYLFGTEYQPFIKGEIKLIGLESPQIKDRGGKLIEAFNKAERQLLELRPDIEKQWYEFKFKINNNGRLLSYYEIDEEQNLLFKDNNTGRKEADNAINVLLEFYRNAEERDKYAAEQITASKENILVIRGEEHRSVFLQEMKKISNYNKMIDIKETNEEKDNEPNSLKGRQPPKPSFGHSGNEVDKQFIEAQQAIQKKDFAEAKNKVREAIRLLRDIDYEELDDSNFPVADMVNQTKVAIWVLEQLTGNTSVDNEILELLSQLRRGKNGLELKEALGYKTNEQDGVEERAINLAKQLQDIASKPIVLSDATKKQQEYYAYSNIMRILLVVFGYIPAYGYLRLSIPEVETLKSFIAQYPEEYGIDSNNTEIIFYNKKAVTKIAPMVKGEFILRGITAQEIVANVAMQQKALDGVIFGFPLSDIRAFKSGRRDGAIGGSEFISWSTFPGNEDEYLKVRNRLLAGEAKIKQALAQAGMRIIERPEIDKNIIHITSGLPSELQAQLVSREKEEINLQKPNKNDNEKSDERNYRNVQMFKKFIKDYASQENLNVNNAIEILRGKRIIDLGCGKNGFLVHALRNSYGLDAYGVDLDLEENVAYPYLSKGDMTNLSRLTDKEFDIVISILTLCTEVFEWNNNNRYRSEEEFYDATAKEIKRVLKSNGEFWYMPGFEGPKRL